MQRKGIWALIAAIVCVTTLLWLVNIVSCFRATVKEPVPTGDLVIIIPTWMLLVPLVAAIAIVLILNSVRRKSKLTETQMGILVSIGAVLVSIVIFLFLGEQAVKR